MRVYWSLHRLAMAAAELARGYGRRARAAVLGLGDRVECPCCDRSFVRFVGPDLECPTCGAHERHRLLWVYLFEHAPGLLAGEVSLLHFAPEPVFERRFRSMRNLRYVTSDLNPKRGEVVADITALPFPEAGFDVVLCSHVLEHVGDDHQALTEIGRVLRPGGTALLLVPLDESRAETYEDPSITSPSEREKAFRQYDHVRVYGRDFTERVRAAGLDVEIDQFHRRLDPALVQRRRMRSGLWVCRKPR